MTKPRFALTLLAAVTLGAITQSAQAQRTLRLPHCCAAASHFDVAAEKFAELLDKKTGGKLKVKVFPGGQLGQETEVIQNVQSGTIEFTIIGHDPLAQYAPVTTLLSQPYLFKDHAQAFRALKGPVGIEIQAALLRRQLRVLGWGDNGARVYTNSRGPIEKPEDLKGLKIRSPQSPVNLAITKALGGIPVAMPYGEVYTALQQKTIDGQENAVINIYPAKLQEVQKFMSMTNHLLSFAVLIVNERFFNGLPADQKKAVQDAANEAMVVQRQHVAKITDELVEKMKAEGVKVNTPNLDAFRKATASLHEEYVGKNFSRDLYELVLKTK